MRGFPQRARFYLVPERIKSASDGQVHYIDAQRLRALYNVPEELCDVWPGGDGLRGRGLEFHSILRPQYEGNYNRIPGPVCHVGGVEIRVYQIQARACERCWGIADLELYQREAARVGLRPVLRWWAKLIPGYARKARRVTSALLFAEIYKAQEILQGRALRLKGAGYE